MAARQMRGPLTVARITALALVAALVVSVGGPLGRARADANPAPGRWQGTWTSATMAGGTDADGTWPARKYFVYVPPALAQPASLVVYLHGTTQTATDAALAAKWNDLADQQGFVVAYPQESTTEESGSTTDGSNDARFWAWGRAAYEARGSGEMRTIAEITKTVAAQYGVTGSRTFLGGLSAGAIMTTAMAATYPDLYAAAASWAGCSYLCADPTGELAYQRMASNARVVPAILFSGSTDYLVNAGMTLPQVTGFVGMNDLADDGASNGSVSQTPTSGPTNFDLDAASLQPAPNTGPPDGSRGDAGTCLYASHPKGNNPCPGSTLGWETYPTTVTCFGYKAAPSDVVVASWYIHGISHNYAGGSTDGTFSDPTGPDTTAAAWDFFNHHDCPHPPVRGAVR